MPKQKNIYLAETNRELHQWLQTQLGPSKQISSYITPQTRLAIYGDDYAEKIHSDYPNHSTKIALILTRECETPYLDLLNSNVHHIIYQQSPFAADALHLAIQAANKEQVIPDPFKNNIHPIRNPNDIGNLYETAKQFGIDNGLPIETSKNFSLALKEAVTNSIFHGFRKKGTHLRRYNPDRFTGLDNPDQVKVSLIATQQWCAIRVSDNSGSLGPLRVANSLDRHHTPRGLMDIRGRGFYLMKHLAHRMIITIQRGARTSVELYFLKKDPGPTLRHLEIIEL